MSKLAHSDEASMKKIESDRLLRDDPTLYRCSGCGLAAPEEIKPCDCITGVGYRRINGVMEHVIFKDQEKPMPAPAAVQIELKGPINGISETDLRGSYFGITMVFPDDEVVRGKISRGELEAMHTQAGHLLSKPLT